MEKKLIPNYINSIFPISQSTIDMASPFKDVKVAFIWLNKDFPSYHSHSHWEILVVMSGEIRHKINNTNYVLKQGDACLIRPNDKHSLHLSSDCHIPHQHLNFIIDNEFAEKILNLYDDYNALLEVPNALHFHLDDSDIVTIYEKALFTQNLSQAEYETSTKLIITNILSKFFEQKLLFNPNYPNWFNVFLTYISNPNNFGKTVEELSKNTSYSYSRLSYLFKEYTGITLTEYINEKKMIYAKRLLQTTNLTTLQISNTIGYGSLSSFNHLFKKSFDVTPSEYRKKHKNKLSHVAKHMESLGTDENE